MNIKLSEFETQDYREVYLKAVSLMGRYSDTFIDSNAMHYDMLGNPSTLEYALAKVPVDRLVKISLTGNGVDLVIDPSNGSIYKIISKNFKYNVLFLGSYKKLKNYSSQWNCGELFTAEPEGLVVTFKSNNLLQKLVSDFHLKVDDYWLCYFYELNHFSSAIASLSRQQSDSNGQFEAYW